MAQNEAAGVHAGFHLCFHLPRGYFGLHKLGFPPWFLRWRDMGFAAIHSRIRSPQNGQAALVAGFPLRKANTGALGS